MFSRRSVTLAVVATAMTCAATIVPSRAQTVYASRTTVVTGSFTVGASVLTLRAETRLRPIVSVAPTEPTGIGSNLENTTSVMVCNQQGCAQPANRLCYGTDAVVDDEATGQGAIHITSTLCNVDVSATVSSPRTPQVAIGRIESTSSAVFEEGSTIQGSTGVGTDGKVVRTINWFAG
jgi:hypothetical protein